MAPGTHVADRPPAAARRRGPRRDRRRDAPARRPRPASRPTRSPSAAFAAATERKRPGALRPGPVRRVHERRRRLRRRAARSTPSPARSRPRARCSTTSRIGSTGSTTTSSRRRRSTPTRPRRSSTAASRSWRCSSGPGYVELVHEIAGAAGGLAGRARLRLGARRGEHGRDARAVGHAAASSCSARRWTTRRTSRSIDRTADVILLSREAIANGPRPAGSSGPSGSASGRTSSTRPGSSSCGGRSSTSARRATSRGESPAGA